MTGVSSGLLILFQATRMWTHFQDENLVGCGVEDIYERKKKRHGAIPSAKDRP